MTLGSRSHFAPSLVLVLGSRKQENGPLVSLNITPVTSQRQHAEVSAQ